MTDSTIPHNHVAIIGTGFGGIATAIRLQQDGFHDFVLLERANDIGGVWRDNDYLDEWLVRNQTAHSTAFPRTLHKGSSIGSRLLPPLGAAIGV